MKSESSWSPPHRELLLCSSFFTLSSLINIKAAVTLAYATPSLILLLKLPVQKGTPSAGIAAQVVVSKLVCASDSLVSWYSVPN